MHLLLVWLLTAVGLIVAAYLLPGIEVEDFSSALWAALIIGLLNVTLGFLLRILAFPLYWLLPGLIYFLVTALMILLAGRILKGFVVKNYVNALLAALIVSIIHALLG